MQQPPPRRTTQTIFQAAEHSCQTISLAVKHAIIVFIKERLAASDLQMRDRFHQRAVRNPNKSSKIAIRRPSAAFRNVGRDRNCGSPHLTGKSEPLFRWKTSSHSIHDVRKINRLMPHIEFFETKQAAPPMHQELRAAVRAPCPSTLVPRPSTSTTSTPAF